MPIDDPELTEDVEIAHAWANQVIEQMYERRPWTLDVGDDPFGKVLEIDGLRSRLKKQGLEVPAIVDPHADPLGNLIGWREFLATLITVH